MRSCAFVLCSRDLPMQLAKREEDWKRREEEWQATREEELEMAKREVLHARPKVQQLLAILNPFYLSIMLKFCLTVQVMYIHT